MSDLGVVKPDGASISVAENGTLSVTKPLLTETQSIEGDGETDEFTITHELATNLVSVVAFLITSSDDVVSTETVAITKWEATSDSSVTLTLASAPTDGARIDVVLMKLDESATVAAAADA
ncbi:MAG: hypothetical protein Q4C95_11435 [Planctomycetia bacterium]|nr:hypothetical protein [Planctomycetia bacterium]